MSFILCGNQWSSAFDNHINKSLNRICIHIRSLPPSSKSHVPSLEFEFLHRPIGDGDPSSLSKRTKPHNEEIPSNDTYSFTFARSPRIARAHVPPRDHSKFRFRGYIPCTLYPSYEELKICNEVQDMQSTCSVPSTPSKIKKKTEQIKFENTMIIPSDNERISCTCRHRKLEREGEFGSRAGQAARGEERFGGGGMDCIITPKLNFITLITFYNYY